MICTCLSNLEMRLLLPIDAARLSCHEGARKRSRCIANRAQEISSEDIDLEALLQSCSFFDRFWNRERFRWRDIRRPWGQEGNSDQTMPFKFVPLIRFYSILSLSLHRIGLFYWLILVWSAFMICILTWGQPRRATSPWRGSREKLRSQSDTRWGLASPCAGHPSLYLSQDSRSKATNSPQWFDCVVSLN